MAAGKQPAEELRSAGTAKKKKAKAGPPSAEMQALMRTKRERERGLKAAQREARAALLAGLGALERDALEDAIDVAAWTESGALPERHV